MPKIDVNKAAEILKKNHLEPALLRRIVEEFTLALTPAELGEKLPAVKKQFVFLVSDPDGLLPRTDFAGWALQIPESESPATTLERIHRAAYDFNTTKRGRLFPVRTVGEALEHIPAAALKEADVWVKTRTPVILLRTNNEIPGIETDQMRLDTTAATAPAA